MLTKIIENKIINNNKHRNKILQNQYNRDKHLVCSSNIQSKQDKMRERTRYGYFSAFVGVICNLSLVIIELIIGFLSGSAAIISDAIHNILDVTSSVITIISFKLSSLPKSKKYPGGLGKVEYLFSFIISIIIFGVGGMFLKNSIQHIFTPQLLTFNYIFLVIMAIGVCLKFWLSHYYMKMGKKINSSILISSGIDAKNDLYILIGSISTLIIYKLFNINIDTYISLFISVMILRSGYYISKDAINHLIGIAPDEELQKQLINYIKHYPIVKDVYGLLLNDYGINNQMISLHIKINNDDIDIQDLDKQIDKIEKDIEENFSISVVIETEPNNDNN